MNTNKFTSILYLKYFKVSLRYNGINVIMGRTSNVYKRVCNNYMQNLELQSLHYWFKHTPAQNPSIMYDNVLNIMQNSIYKLDASDIIGTSNQHLKNSTPMHRTYFHDRVILKNVFEHWKMYVIHKLYIRKATYRADYFYRKKLQVKVLNELSKNVLSKWKHIVSSMDNCTVNKVAVSVKCVKTEIYCNKILLKTCFMYWYKYVKMKYEKRKLLEKALILYDLCCLKKCLMHWKIYIEKQRQTRIMQDKIDEAAKFYSKNILDKYMKAWINVCQFTCQTMKNATVHYESKLLTKYFSAWIAYHDYKVEKLNRKEYIEEYSRRKFLKQYFQRFIICVNESITNKIVLEEAKIFYNLKLLQKTFFLWEEWYNKKLQTVMKINEITSIIEIKRKRKVLIKWRLYIFEKKCRRRKLLLALNFCRKKNTMKHLKKLYAYSVYKKNKEEKLSHLRDKSDAIVRQLQSIYMEKWRKALYITVQEKCKLSKATKFWELNSYRKHFLYWEEFSKQYKLKSICKHKLNELACNFFLKRFIQLWHRKMQDVLEIREKESLVTTIIQHKIIKRCLLSWKQYIIQNVKMRNDIEAAKEMHKKFLLREGLKEILKNSLHSIDYQSNVQLESAATRSFKNMEILKEYLDKWYSLIYVKNKSRILCKNIKNNDCQISCDNMLNNVKNTRLVLPEYMKKTETISTFPDFLFTREQVFNF